MNGESLDAPIPRSYDAAVLIIDRKTVAAVLDFDQLVDALAPAMVELSRGAVSMPPRTGPRVAEVGGVLGVMPAYLPGSQTLACKLVSIYPNNAARDLPTHLALILVFDAPTGLPLALMDGTDITATRTAAGSALATRLLAPPDASVLAIVGTGVQARSHAIGIPRVRPVAEVRIAGRSVEKARALAEELASELAVPVHAASSVEEALQGADLVCTTTHSPEPVLRWKWLAPGAHVNAVGLDVEGRELDEDTVANSAVFVEARSSVLAPPPAGANDLLFPIRDGRITAEHILAEVGEVATGSHPGRTSAEQVTLYKSVGVAVQDAVAAKLVLDAARERGLGVEVAVE